MNGYHKTLFGILRCCDGLPASLAKLLLVTSILKKYIYFWLCTRTNLNNYNNFTLISYEKTRYLYKRKLKIRFVLPTVNYKTFTGFIPSIL